MGIFRKKQEERRRHIIKKNGFFQPIFAIEKKNDSLAINFMEQYPKLYKKLCDLAKEEQVTTSQMLAVLLQNEFERMENAL